MPRSRNIKPSFFTNDELAEIEPIGRLLFIGLWTIADYKGELEWRPKKIKAQLLPYDNCSIEEIAINLDKSGFIRFYSNGDKKYVNIPNFDKHQNPHKNEKEKGSDIPRFEDCQSETPEIEPSEKNHDKSRLNQELNGSDPADSCFLIPDSCSLIPDTAAKAASCPHKEILEVFAEELPELPQPVEWGDERQKMLRARWRENKDRQSIEWWRGFFQYVSKSDYLMGRVNDFNATLPWILKKGNFLKVVEGNYENK